MKKILYILIACLCLFSLSGCRKDLDKNLQLVSQNKTEYVVKYYSKTQKNFGDLFITIVKSDEGEKISNFYVVYYKEYVLDTYELKVGSYYNEITASEVSEVDGKNKVVFTLTNELKLIDELDEEKSVYDTCKTFELMFSVSFTPAENTEVKESSLKFYVNPQEIVEFVRNKTLKVREDA